MLTADKISYRVANHSDSKIMAGIKSLHIYFLGIDLMLTGLKSLFSSLKLSSSAAKQSALFQDEKLHSGKVNLTVSGAEQYKIKQAPPLNLKVLGDTYYRQLVGVTSLHHSPLNTQEREVLAQIETLIDSQKQSATLIPRMPGIIPKLMTYLRADDYNSKDIAKLISTDPVLVAEVLRLINSPYFRTAAHSNDLEQAVFQLGHAGLRELIMSVALKPIMKFDKGYIHQDAAENISALSQKAAVACRCLATAAKVDPFDAYVAGLLHNTGAMIVLRQLNQIPQPLEVTRSKNFQHTAIKYATQLSFLIAEQWGLTEPVITCLKEQIGNHRIRPDSDLGQILEIGIRIAQLHTLVGSGQYESPDYILDILAQQSIGNNSLRAYKELETAENLAS